MSVFTEVDDFCCGANDIFTYIKLYDTDHIYIQNKPKTCEAWKLFYIYIYLRQYNHR